MATMKKVTPRKTATPVIKWMKWLISLAIGVSPISSPEARLAILPMIVRSPVLMTIPLAVPSTQFVEKNARFFVSSGLSFVKSGDLDWGSDSPVRQELSTLQPWATTILKSAGIRSPPLTSTTSPTTSWSAGKVCFCPSRITVAYCGVDKNKL